MAKKPAAAGGGSAVSKVLEMIKEHDVKYVDFRFTDPRGKWQHLPSTSRPSTRTF